MKYNLILIAAIIVTSCGRRQAETMPEETTITPNNITLSAAQYEAANITWGTIAHHQVGTALHASGLLDVPPQNLITIAAPMGGFVKSTNLLQGMKVKKGDVLATMEHQDYIQLQQDYLETRSKLEFSESEYNRQLALAKENVNAEKTVQQARSQYEGLRAAVKGLEARLAMINLSAAALADGNIRPTINLYSPISGFVTVVNVNLGQFVNATDVMFKIVNIEHLHAELQVYERDIHKIAIGQKVYFTLANENRARAASVYLLGKEISPERTVRIHCHLDEEDESLLPGMYVSASIQTGLHDADLLPVEAVVSFEGQDFIFVEGKQKSDFELITVKTGDTSTTDSVEVFVPPGFDKNRPIVTRGAFELLGAIKNRPAME